MIEDKIVLKNTRKYGKGIFAKCNIKKGVVIATFDGKIYDETFTKWTTEILNHVIQFDKMKWRDSEGLARYINHSCEPNCGVRGRFDIVTMRSIKKGEQITWDYEMTERNIWGWQLKCKCGNKNCRKIIGNYDNMPEDLRLKYRGFISTWLCR